jgi:hypothetical protein
MNIVPLYHLATRGAVEAVDQMAEQQATIERLKAESNKWLRLAQKFECENEALREAILTWWDGSPEDMFASDDQLGQVAVALLEKDNE